MNDSVLKKVLISYNKILNFDRQSSTNICDLLIRSGSITTFVNPYSHQRLQRSTLFRDFMIDELSYIFIDGISLVVLYNFFSKSKLRRISFDFTSLAGIVLEHCTKHNLSVAFIGSTQPCVEAAVLNINERYCGLNIAYVRNGYFKSNTEVVECIDEIIKSNPDVVIAGLGTPFQESFLLDLKKAGYIGSSFTCGGFIEQTSERTDYYPKMFDTLNMRWIYRIYREPKRLIRRYVFDYPYSLILITLSNFNIFSKPNH